MFLKTQDLKCRMRASRRLVLYLQEGCLQLWIFASICVRLCRSRLAWVEKTLPHNLHFAGRFVLANCFFVVWTSGTSSISCTVKISTWYFVNSFLTSSRSATRFSSAAIRFQHFGWLLSSCYQIYMQIESRDSFVHFTKNTFRLHRFYSILTKVEICLITFFLFLFFSFFCAWLMT